jgi:hypothetical protein
MESGDSSCSVGNKARIWKKGRREVVPYFKILFQNPPGETAGF